MLPKLAQVHVRHGSTDATQDQVMVCAGPCVSDRHVLEQTMVCAQNVVGPVVQLPYSAENALCLAVLQPWLVSWEEVPIRVLKPCRGHG